MHKELSLEELTDKIGIDCMLEVNRQIEKVSRLLGLTFNIKIFEESIFYIIKDDNRDILYVDKFLLFIKPFEYFRLKSLKVFDDYESNTGNRFGETSFYDNLIQLKVSEKTESFIHYYLIYILDYFNLEADEAKMTKTKDNIVVIHSVKYEFVYKNETRKEINYQKIWLVIRVSLETDEIKVTKIYPAQKYQNIYLKLMDIL